MRGGEGVPALDGDPQGVAAAVDVGAPRDQLGAGVAQRRGVGLQLGDEPLQLGELRRVVGRRPAYTALGAPSECLGGGHTGEPASNKERPGHTAFE
jgi:hypothetical protein